MFRLSINTGFAVNRYSEHDEWVRVISQSGVNYAQLTADLINPMLGDKIINRHIEEIKEACQKYNVNITSTFTGAFTRLNHLAHPDKEVQKYWIEWFKRFADISKAVGSDNFGSHFGIFTTRDCNDKNLKKERRQQNIENWHEIGKYAKKIGIKYISWEPMSIKREQAETQQEARLLQTDVNKDSPIPFLICLDVDHGDVTSSNKIDTDPYSWISNFAKEAPLLHLKQSQKDKSGHYPFTEEYNITGKIIPKKILKTLLENGRDDADLILELSFREREPFDSSVEKVLKESVLYWRQYVQN